ncbi:hypothetical protein E1292_37665 [Nonomuraea deserti]|uniref:Uncharacterized protein n=1 Tax=Nonomuraea deserti TaxID=1848322 RepID=A0A4R4UX27_9ACTN|nr:hypothetical protein [Nonomuraea deserti]TDC97127.1 hypothetical protein E1292_37665 [Nonomuraea deserti]
MSRNGKVRDYLLSLIVAASGVILSLAANAASAQDEWFGPLDYIRQYPWLIIAVTTPAAAYITFRTMRSGQENSRVDPVGPVYDMRGATFESISLPHLTNTALQSTAKLEDKEHAQLAQTKEKQSLRYPVVLYWRSAFFDDDGNWEDTAVAVTKEVHPNLRCVQFVERNHARSDVVAILLLVSAGQIRGGAKMQVRAKLQEAEQHYPLVRLILCAVGLSDDPITDRDGRRMLKNAGLSPDHSRFLICPTEQHFYTKLSAVMQTAVTVGVDQSILDRPNQTSDSGSEVE